MRISIANRQTASKVDGARLADFVRAIWRRVERMAPALRWDELIVVLTDERDIRRVNRTYLGSSGSTDVIVFRYEPGPVSPAGHSGEIVVNVRRAREEGSRRRHGPSGELALYVAHGCDHLAGEDDSTRKGRERMRRREMRWLRAAARAGLLKGIIRNGGA